MIRKFLHCIWPGLIEDKLIGTEAERTGFAGTLIADYYESGLVVTRVVWDEELKDFVETSIPSQEYLKK